MRKFSIVCLADEEAASLDLAVKMGRIPKEEKERALEKAQQQMACFHDLNTEKQPETKEPPSSRPWGDGMCLSTGNGTNGLQQSQLHTNQMRTQTSLTARTPNNFDNNGKVQIPGSNPFLSCTSDLLSSFSTPRSVRKPSNERPDLEQNLQSGQNRTSFRNVWSLEQEHVASIPRFHKPFSENYSVDMKDESGLASFSQAQFSAPVSQYVSRNQNDYCPQGPGWVQQTKPTCVNGISDKHDPQQDDGCVHNSGYLTHSERCYGPGEVVNRILPNDAFQQANTPLLQHSKESRNNLYPHGQGSTNKRKIDPDDVHSSAIAYGTSEKKTSWPFATEFVDVKEKPRSCKEQDICIPRKPERGSFVENSGPDCSMPSPDCCMSITNSSNTNSLYPVNEATETFAQDSFFHKKINSDPAPFVDSSAQAGSSLSGPSSDNRKTNSGQVFVSGYENIQCNRNACSPDVIKLLIHQMGKEMFKNIREEILTQISEKCTPEEYKSTVELLQMVELKNEGITGTLIDGKPLHRSNSIDTYLKHLNIADHQDLSSLRKSRANSDNVYKAVPDEEFIPGASERTFLNDGPMPLRPHGQEYNLTPNQALSTIDDHFVEMKLDDMFCSEKDLGVDVPDSDCENQSPSLTEVTMFPTKHEDISRNCDFDFGQDQSVNASSEQEESRSVEKLSPDSAERLSPVLRHPVEEVDMALQLGNSFTKCMETLRDKQERMKHYVETKEPLPVHPINPASKTVVYKLLLESIPSVSKFVTDFCREIPGFQNLLKVDREILVKRAYYDIWMLAFSNFFQDGQSYLQLSDGTFYSREWMEEILNATMVDKIISFTDKFNSLKLTEQEIAILCSIQVTAPGHDEVDLTAPSEIQHLNSELVDLLVKEVSKQHPVTCSRILVDIFRLLPALSEINMMQRYIIASFSMEKAPEKVVEPPPMVDLGQEDLFMLSQI